MHTSSIIQQCQVILLVDTRHQTRINTITFGNDCLIRVGNPISLTLTMPKIDKHQQSHPEINLGYYKIL